MTEIDPTRCRYCGVALNHDERLRVHYELDTGETHWPQRCRDYLVAERDRLRTTLEDASAALDIALAPLPEDREIIEDAQRACHAVLEATEPTRAAVCTVCGGTGNTEGIPMPQGDWIDCPACHANAKPA